MFDVLILCHKKDFNKLEFVVKSVQKNIEGYHNLFCITSIPMPDRFRSDGVQYFHDDEVNDFDYTKINQPTRRGWYRQQFIKLFQGITCDNYLVIDSDAYLNRKFVIDTAHPAFYLGRDQHHLPYFVGMTKLCGIGREYPYSFISEMMFFRRGVINDLLNRIEVDRYEFFDLCAGIINSVDNLSGFSEYELYGNYVTKYFPDLYSHEKIKVLHQKKYAEWTDDEIRKHIHYCNKTNYDICTMHSYL